MMICDPINAKPFCKSLAWQWLAVDPRPCQSPRKVQRPCGRCGHGASDHWFDPHHGHEECLSAHCGCAWFKLNQERSEETRLSSRASCADVCTCGGDHTVGTNYYVSVRRDNGDVGLLLGPFLSHSVALDHVHIGEQLAHRVSFGAPWLAYGTVAMSSYAKPGVLNDLLEVQS